MPDSETLQVYAFSEAGPYVRVVSRKLGAGFSPVRTYRFPDGETVVRVKPTSGARAVLVHSLNDPDGHLSETLFAAHALRHAGARRVTLAAPYPPYVRQDQVFRNGKPTNAIKTASLLAGALAESR